MGKSTRLTEKQRRFAEFVCAGFSYSDAYRYAFACLNASTKTINKDASRLAALPKIQSAIEEQTITASYSVPKVSGSKILKLYRASRVRIREYEAMKATKNLLDDIVE